MIEDIIYVRLSGAQTRETIIDCHESIRSFCEKSQCDKVLYDAKDMEKPPLSLVYVQQDLEATNNTPLLRRAVVVSKPGVAFYARLAFNGDQARVFYDEVPEAIKWLQLKAG